MIKEFNKDFSIRIDVSDCKSIIAGYDANLNFFLIVSGMFILMMSILYGSLQMAGVFLQMRKCETIDKL